LQRRSVVGTSGSLLLHAAHLASLDAGGGGELDVLLGRNTDHEGGNVDHLLANGDVLLADQHAGVMDRVSELALHHEGLQTAFHELGDGQTQDVIELALRLLEETKTNHTAEEGLTCISLSYNHIYYAHNLPSKILRGSFSGMVRSTLAAFLQRGYGNCGLPESGEGQLQSPDLSLVLKAVGTNESQPKRDKGEHEAIGKVVGGSATTYSLISFSFSKGLLGVLEVFLSEIWVKGARPTVRVLLWHLVELIYKAYRYQ
jgi:hypothetical protein